MNIYGVTNIESLQLIMAFVVMDNLHKNKEIITEWVEESFYLEIELKLIFYAYNHSILFRILTLVGHRRYRMIFLDVKFALRVHSLLGNTAQHTFPTLYTFKSDSHTILRFVFIYFLRFFLYSIFVLLFVYFNWIHNTSEYVEWLDAELDRISADSLTLDVLHFMILKMRFALEELMIFKNQIK